MNLIKQPVRRLASPLKRLWRNLATDYQVQQAKRQRADIAIFHEFAPPPAGGGHQFLRALWHEFDQRGLRVENNTISPTTRACLFNSFNFDTNRLRRFRRTNCRMVHRVDGPIDLYRGRDSGEDRRIWQINEELADATIFQSHFSLAKHAEVGLLFRNPVVIVNAPDPTIFHNQGRMAFAPDRKIRLLSSSWSDNPNKGAAVYQWLDEHLDWSRYEYTFIGRTPVPFKHIRRVAPLPSTQLADEMRRHDIFITASQNDPCSNALIEALTCGLPALYLQSGGHPELVGTGGLGFAATEEIPALLEQIIDNYTLYQQRIRAPEMSIVAAQYLAVLGLTETGAMNR
ncbi:MAG: glycosyltransferase family 4 protein [Caldilineaceae bacterium]|nr:glycosyltransferase family 4 protein [Caldilineaceae bacterium]